MLQFASASAVKAARVQLSTEERAWLDNNPDKMILLFNVEFPPIEFSSKSGTFVGMGADVVDRVETLLNVHFIKKPSDDWNAHLAALKSGECAIAPTIVRTNEREEYAFFTQPYATVPVVIITKNSVSEKLSLNNLAGKRIGVVSGFATEKYIRDQALLGSFHVIPVKNVQDGLQSVSFGQVDAFVENLAVAAYYINKSGIPNLRVAGTTDFSFAWSIGVSRKYPYLYSSIQKALNSVPESELKTIRNQWISLQSEAGFDPETKRLLRLVVTFAVLLLVGLLCITFILKSRLNQKINDLSKSEGKYKRLAENSPAVVFQFEMSPTGEFNFSYVNEVLIDITGISAEAATRDASLILNLVHPDDHAAFYASITESATSLNPYHASYRFVKNGEVGWLEIHSTPERLPSGAIIWDGFLIDITERRRAEEAVKQRESYLTAIIENQPGLVWLKDAESRFLAVNRMFAKSCGKEKRSEVVGKTDLDIWPAELANKYRKDDFDIMSSGIPVVTEEQIFDNGEMRWFETFKTPVRNEFGVIIGTTGFSRDITERKQVEKILQEREERLQLALHGAELGTWDWNVTTGYVKFNDRWAEMLGYQYEEIAQDISSWEKLVHPDDKEEVNKILAAHLEGKTEFYAVENRLRHKSGKWVWVLDKGRVVDRDEFGRPLRMCGTHLDVTDRKIAEEEQKQLQSQLIQAQKMESVGRLAGGVAHDFNNMLGVILGHTEMLLSTIDQNSDDYRNLEEIHKAAMRSADLTSKLLAFARKQTVIPKILDLNSTVEGMLNMLHRLIGENIELTWSPGSNLWQINMDPSQIDQILANLCINARDAISGIGKITIQTRNIVVDDNNDNNHNQSKHGEFIVLSVTDNGCGMNEETLKHIYEPFFTTKELGKGTGLGLASVYGIVEQNKGYIEVSSEESKGTTFEIYLPRFQTTIVRSNEISTSQPIRGSETILLVEDEPAILRMAASMLERMGYNIVPANSPEAAIRIASTDLNYIDLLITDVVMPEMNGRDLMLNLKQRFPDMRHIFMSGYTAEVIEHEGVLDEEYNFIQKPFSMKDLAAKVRYVLDRN